MTMMILKDADLEEAYGDDLHQNPAKHFQAHRSEPIYGSLLAPVAWPPHLPFHQQQQQFKQGVVYLFAKIVENCVT